MTIVFGIFWLALIEASLDLMLEPISDAYCEYEYRRVLSLMEVA